MLVRTLAALVLVLGACASSEPVRPVLPVADPTSLQTTDPGDAAPGDPVTPTPGQTTAAVDEALIEEPEPQDAEEQLDRSAFAAVVELAPGEQVSDRQGNRIAVYGATVLPSSYEKLRPFDRTDVELFGGIEDVAHAASGLAAIDIGFCAAGLDAPQREGAAFSVHGGLDDPAPSRSSDVLVRHQVVLPGFSLPGVAECSRGWLVLSWSGDGNPAVARYDISARTAQGDVERRLYQWQVEVGAPGEPEALFGVGETVTFNSGALAGSTVEFGGYTELVDDVSPIEGTRLVGASVRVCRSGAEWPQLGMGVDGWNLTAPIEALPDADDAGCFDDWVRFAVPAGGVPTSLFASDGRDPEAGFVAWTLIGAALPTPR